MRVVVFGARGRLGSAIARELARRNHTVRAVRRPGRQARSETVEIPTVLADVTDAESVAEAVRGADVVISAVGPGPDGDPAVLPRAARALLDGLRRSGSPRLISIGGAGSLEVPPGGLLLDAPEFPEAWRPVARAHLDALAIYRAERELEWTVVSPAATVETGPRTGHYKAGIDLLVTDAHGASRISPEDLAVAVVDEVETPRHVRRRFAVAWP
jgi:uncharacterized protein